MNKLVTAMGLLCAAGWCVSAATAQVTLEKVISNGDPVPTVAGAAWTYTTTPFCFSSGGTIDQNGVVAFKGKMLAGQGGVVANTNDEIEYYGAPGNLQYFARKGDQVPGMPAGTTLTSFQTTTVPRSANGNIWFGGGCSPNPSGFISTGTFGTVSLVVRRGDTMPGGDVLAANPASTGSGSANVNSKGQIAFTGAISGGLSSAVYVGGPGTLQLAFKPGVAYSSLPGGTSLANTGYVLMNGQGDIAASGYLTQDGTTLTDANNEVVFTRASGAANGVFTMMAREGDPAPGCGGATFIRGLYDPGLGLEAQVFNQFAGNFNNAGHAIFSAGLEGTGVTTSNNVGLWYSDGTTTHLFRRMGDACSAVPGATYSFTGGLANNGPTEAARVRLNNSDTVVWNATLTPGVGGVTASTSATLMRTTLGSSTDTLLARQGSPVTDPVSSAVVIPGALWGSTLGNIQQNNRGQILFLASLTDDGSGTVFSTNNQALMAWDPVGGLTMVYRKGDDLSSVVGFSPDSISMGAPGNGNAEGGSNMLADNGWFTFGVSFSIQGTNSAIVRGKLPAAASCYANCDGSTTAPILNVADFTCFLQKYAAGDPYANCDASTTPPVLNVADFTCFLQKYAAGCQ
jgi:hypothetical protein